MGKQQHTCPVCRDVMYRPHRVQPCQHTFCAACLCLLNRYKTTEFVLCPLCRAVVRRCLFHKELDRSIREVDPLSYFRRKEFSEQVERDGADVPEYTSNINFFLELPPVAWILRQCQRLRRPRQPAPKVKLFFGVIILLWLPCVLYSHAYHLIGLSLTSMLLQGVWTRLSPSLRSGLRFASHLLPLIPAIWVLTRGSSAVLEFFTTLPASSVGRLLVATFMLLCFNVYGTPAKILWRVVETAYLCVYQVPLSFIGFWVTLHIYVKRLFMIFFFAFLLLVFVFLLAFTLSLIIGR